MVVWDVLVKFATRNKVYQGLLQSLNKITTTTFTFKVTDKKNNFPFDLFKHSSVIAVEECIESRSIFCLILDKSLKIMVCVIVWKEK